MFLDILSDVDILWTTKERTDSNIMKTVCVKISQFLKYHRNVTKKTNPLQVQNAITVKSLAILEVSIRILSTQCIKISALAKVENF
jgi:hypothetical protein